MPQGEGEQNLLSSGWNARPSASFLFKCGLAFSGMSALALGEKALETFNFLRPALPPTAMAFTGYSLLTAAIAASFFRAAYDKKPS